MNAQRLSFWLRVSASAALVAAFSSTPAFGSVVLYGGDADGDKQRSCLDDSMELTLMFDNFQLTTAMTLTKLWGNYSEPYSGPNRVGGGMKKMGGADSGLAYYEIRSGVNDGSSGVLVASGMMSTVITPTGRSVGLTSAAATAESQWLGNVMINLAAGEYWLGIAPIRTNAGALMLSTTQGADLTSDNLPDMDPNPLPGYWPLDGNSFVMVTNTSTSPFSWEPALGNWDFSYGVEAVAVPETSTFLAGLLLLLPAGVQGWRWVRRGRDHSP
jgi:hypothetical protein